MFVTCCAFDIKAGSYSKETADLVAAFNVLATDYRGLSSHVLVS
jgi:hypothetical protein